jgi:hypothetical protein
MTSDLEVCTAVCTSDAENIQNPQSDAARPVIVAVVVCPTDPGAEYLVPLWGDVVITTAGITTSGNTSQRDRSAAQLEGVSAGPVPSSWPTPGSFDHRYHRVPHCRGKVGPRADECRQLVVFARCRRHHQSYCSRTQQKK